MRAILILVLIATTLSAAEPTASQKLQAKAALALAFAPPSYREQHAKALKEAKPLVVYVGVPAKKIPGCVDYSCEKFPDVAHRGVVLGLPDGTALRRIDLLGFPSEETIRQTVAGTKPTAGMVGLPNP
jgi:hypothetical protein